PVNRVLAGQQLLRQGRSRVGQVALLADHHELAIEPGFPCGLGRAQPGQRGPNDDQATHRAYSSIRLIAFSGQLPTTSSASSRSSSGTSIGSPPEIVT